MITVDENKLREVLEAYEDYSFNGRTVRQPKVIAILRAMLEQKPVVTGVRYVHNSTDGVVPDVTIAHPDNVYAPGLCQMSEKTAPCFK